MEQISDFNHRTRTCRSRVHQENRKMLLGELRTMRSKEEFPPKVIDWEIDVFVGGDVTRSRGYLRIRRRGSVGGFDSKSNAGERQSCLEKVKNCQLIPKTSRRLRCSHFSRSCPQTLSDCS